MFGEEPKQLQSDEFFGLFSAFLVSFAVSFFLSFSSQLAEASAVFTFHTRSAKAKFVTVKMCFVVLTREE